VRGGLLHPREEQPDNHGQQDRDPEPQCDFQHRRPFRFLVVAYFLRLIAHSIAASNTAIPTKIAIVTMRASLNWKSEPPAAAHIGNLRIRP
jgi:hypothetical protein